MKDSARNCSNARSSPGRAFTFYGAAFSDRAARPFVLHRFVILPRTSAIGDRGSCPQRKPSGRLVINPCFLRPAFHAVAAQWLRRSGARSQHPQSHRGLQSPVDAATVPRQSRSGGYPSGFAPIPRNLQVGGEADLRRDLRRGRRPTGDLERIAHDFEGLCWRCGGC